jgi:hypothetical protein
VSDGPISNLPSNDRASLDRTSEGIVRRLIGGGIALAARFTTSLRVGSGAATLAAFDGLDGVVMADGATAALVTRDRAANTRWMQWYRNTTIRIGVETGDLWLIDPTTGAATLALTNGAWTTVVAGVGYTNGWSDFGGAFQVMRYRKNILGNVEVQGSMKAGTLGAAAFTLPAGLRPPATIFLTGIDGLNTVQYGQVQSSGAVIAGAGNTAYWNINFSFSTV